MYFIILYYIVTLEFFCPISYQIKKEKGQYNSEIPIYGLLQIAEINIPLSTFLLFMSFDFSHIITWRKRLLGMYKFCSGCHMVCPACLYKMDVVIVLSYFVDCGPEELKKKKTYFLQFSHCCCLTYTRSISYTNYSVLLSMWPADINECSESHTQCGPDKECVNTVGSYYCLDPCDSGLEREHNKIDCVGEYFEDSDVFVFNCLLVWHF